MKILADVKIKGSDFVYDLKRAARESGQNANGACHDFVMGIESAIAEYDFTAQLVKAMLIELAGEHTKDDPLNMDDFKPSKLYQD